MGQFGDWIDKERKQGANRQAKTQQQGQFLGGGPSGYSPYGSPGGITDPSMLFKGAGKGVAQNLRKRFHVLYPYYLQQMEPMRLRTTEMAGLGEQTGTQALNRYASRRGLMGSGAYQTGLAGIGAARQAQVNQALIDYYAKALDAALRTAAPRRAGGGQHDRNNFDWAGTGAQVGTAALSAGIIAASDERLKRNIRPATWEWNERAEKAFGLKGTAAGLIAQDVQKVWPDAVHKVNGYLVVDYPLVAARLADRLRAVE